MRVIQRKLQIAASTMKIFSPGQMAEFLYFAG
jgi:hypothetical protein